MMKKIPWILFGMSLLVGICLLGLLLNGGVALDDARSEVIRLRERNNLALSIVRNDWLGQNKASIVNLSRELKKKGVNVGFEDNNLKIGDFIFVMKDDSVINVNYID